MYGVDIIIIVDTHNYPDVRTCILTIGPDSKHAYQQLAASLVLGDYHLGDEGLYENDEIDAAVEQWYPNGTTFSIEDGEKIQTKPNGEVEVEIIPGHEK